MTISIERIARDIDAIAACSEVAAEMGYSRPTFSDAWRKAVDYIIREAHNIGCQVRWDAWGNLHVRPASVSWDRRVWLSGSHLDSVPSGGKYDGVVGVVAALEVLRAHPAAPLELVAFAEEEGTTFGLGMLGSRAWCGSIDPSGLALCCNRQGESYFAAGSRHGVHSQPSSDDQLDPQRYLGFVELHVEQGAALWSRGQPVAVVTTANGRRQFIATVVGAANHAGSTRMNDRRDALAAAAETILAVERLGRELDNERPGSVMTVGRLTAEPNAFNVIAGRAELTIDLRAREDALLDQGEAALRSRVAEMASRRNISLTLQRIENLSAVPMDEQLCRSLREAGRRIGVELPDACSGALHDAVILAPYMPSAMLFIASRDGISHHPDEYSRDEDIACAAEILAQLVTA